jgi:hypothetical protein
MTTPSGVQAAVAASTPSHARPEPGVALGAPQLREVAVTDEDLRHRVAVRVAGRPQLDPPRGVGRIAAILHRERVGLPFQELPDPERRGEGFGGAGGPVAHREVVLLPLHRRAAVGPPELPPRLVDEQDVAPGAEDRRRVLQSLERLLQERAETGALGGPDVGSVGREALELPGTQDHRDPVGAVLRAEAPQPTRDRPLDRRRREEHLLGDLDARLALGDPCEHLALPVLQDRSRRPAPRRTPKREEMPAAAVEGTARQLERDRLARAGLQADDVPGPRFPAHDRREGREGPQPPVGGGQVLEGAAHHLRPRALQDGQRGRADVGHPPPDVAGQDRARIVGHRHRTGLRCAARVELVWKSGPPHTPL